MLLFHGSDCELGYEWVGGNQKKANEQEYVQEIHSVSPSEDAAWNMFQLA